MFPIPTELTRIKVFGGSSAVTEPKPFVFTPNAHSPIRSAQFVTGDITPTMERHAEEISASWRAKLRRAR